MTLLAALMGARQAIEVGTFTGYSSVCLARRARRRGQAHLLRHQRGMDLAGPHLLAEGGPVRPDRAAPWPKAIDTLRALPAGVSFDLAFIDADKRGYRGYWEELVPRMRPGGVILVDNTLLHGRIFEASPDPDALAIKEFNEHVLTDDRAELVMLPVGDGLTLARVK